MAAILYDQWGAPLAPSGGGRGMLLDATRHGNRERPEWEVRMESISRAATYYDWKTMVSASRRLWANFNTLKAATKMKSMHAVGRAWTPTFKGEDRKWGELAEKFLEGWMKCCDVRGDVYDFQSGLALDSIEIDRDGDNSVLLTETDDGYPQIQRLACHRIGMYGFNTSTVGPADAVSYTVGEDGQAKWVHGLYRGLRIEHGVIYNGEGRAVAHRVIGQFGQTAQDVSTRDMDIRYDPEYCDQGRGFPAFSASINFLASSFLSHKYEQQALLLAGSIGLLEYNETGGADITDPSMINQTYTGDAAIDQQNFNQQTYEGGMIRHFQASAGSRIEAFRNAARPGAEWDSFNDRIIRDALAGVWPYSLVWKPEGMNGTQERSAIELARAIVKDRQDLLMPRARRIVGYAVSKAIKLGILPEYPGEDIGGFLKWGFEMPPEFNIDHGREDASWLAMYQGGASTLAQRLDANQMGTVKAFYLARANEDADMQEAIAEVEAARSVKIDPRSIRMLTPNDQPVAANENQDTPPGNSPATSLDDAAKSAEADDEHDPHI